jgi:hypothetical protein
MQKEVEIETEIKLTLQCDSTTGNIHFYSSFWHDDIVKIMEEMFPNQKIKFPIESEHVGQKKYLCG